MSKLNKGDVDMKKALPALLMLALTAPVLALPDIGEPVKKISFADRIDGWSVIDDRTIVLRKGASQSYVVHLKTDCRMLKYARNVGVSSSNNTVYANFDYVTADNLRCSIDTINSVSKEDLALLRS